MSKEKFKHIVLTRYFVRFDNDPSRASALPDDAWLDERFALFKRFCFPSVASQSVKDFTWHIYFDIRVPEHHITAVRELIRPHDNFKIVLCQFFDESSRRAAIIDELEPDTRWLLTTRLDNDDGWRRDFVEILQNELRFGEREFLNFPVGILLYSDMTFLYRDKSNPFISLLEPADSFITVCCDQHAYLNRIAPIRQLPMSAVFIQVIHGGNHSNKPVGVRVPRFLALAGFEGMEGLGGDHEESDWEIVRYNLTVALMWKLRDKMLRVRDRLTTRAKTVAHAHAADSRRERTERGH